MTLDLANFRVEIAHQKGCRRNSVLCSHTKLLDSQSQDMGLCVMEVLKSFMKNFILKTLFSVNKHRF